LRLTSSGLRLFTTHRRDGGISRQGLSCCNPRQAALQPRAAPARPARALFWQLCRWEDCIDGAITASELCRPLIITHEIVAAVAAVLCCLSESSK